MVGAMAGLTVLGAGMQALGSIQAGKAASKAAGFNAMLSEQDALYTATMGKETQRRLDLQYEQMQGP